MKAINILLVALLIFALTSTLPFAKVAKANPYAPPIWKVQSPQNNTTYNTTSLKLYLIAESFANYDYYYSIDGQQKITMREISRGSTKGRTTVELFLYNKELQNLSEGQHKLDLYHGYYNYFFPDWRIETAGATIIFYIDTTAPRITNLTIANAEATTDRQLNFTIDEATSWIGYSLDNQANATVNGETAVLGDLPAGSHNVTVYATDAAGNVGVSETLFFTVDATNLNLVVPDLYSIIAIIVTTVAIVSVCPLVYFKRRNKRNSRFARSKQTNNDSRNIGCLFIEEVMGNA
jgi:hypothetical protein